MAFKLIADPAYIECCQMHAGKDCWRKSFAGADSAITPMFRVDLVDVWQQLRGSKWILSG